MMVCKAVTGSWRVAIRAALLPIFLLSVLLFLLASNSRACLGAQVNDNMPMRANAAEDRAMTAKMMADKRESEFNHRLAGVFVIIAGLFMLIQTDQDKPFPRTKYVWPATFLASGVFLLVWSDTELWPFGHRQWMEALRNNPEVRQHKTYAVLLLVLGMVEWLRTSGVLRATWRSLTGSHPLDSLSRKILPPQESAGGSLSRQVRRCSQTGLPGRPAQLPGQPEAPGTARDLRFLVAATPPTRLGGLLKTSLRWSRIRAAISRPLHPPCGHLQPSPALFPGWPGHFSLA
jgi:hypothetical protein